MNTFWTVANLSARIIYARTHLLHEIEKKMRTHNSHILDLINWVNFPVEVAIFRPFRCFYQIFWGRKQSCLSASTHADFHVQ